MSIEFCGLSLAHPVINGSGTFDAIAARRAFGDSLAERFPFSAYVSKTITLQPRPGNPPPRLWETPGGLINSIGLPNKGLDGYLREDLPELSSFSSDPGCAVDGAARPVPLITNVMGSTVDELRQLVEACDAQAGISAIELNVSCPNVATGLDIGADPRQLQAVLAGVRDRSSKPLIVKLTPNAADVPECAAAAEAGGADAVSLINTLRALALAPSGAPGERWLGGGTGGLSGASIRPVALAQVGTVARRVDIPVVGMGGIQSSRHARQMLDVGATLVAVGTETFRDPAAGQRVARGLV